MTQLGGRGARARAWCGQSWGREVLGPGGSGQGLAFQPLPRRRAGMRPW